MDFKDLIKCRKSIRKYKDIEIPKDIIKDLIECASLAPSAKNRQPWKFVIVNKEIKDKIADMMIEDEQKRIERKMFHLNSSVIATAKIMKQAPTLILVLTQTEDNWCIGDSLSIGGAIEHICLRATELGLGSLWIRDIVYIQNDIAKLINHDDMQVISAISIGYPDENPDRRPRKDLDEIMEWF